MLLSSIRRLRVHVMGQQANPLSSGLTNDRLLSQWLVAASSAIEKYCDREMEIKSRTEYFDLIEGKKRFWVKGVPITSLTSVYEDPTGLWDGSSEAIISDCFADDNSVNLPYAFDWKGSKAIRVIYTGGLAYHAVRSTFTLSATPTGTWTAGKYIVSSNGSVGVTVSYTAGTRAIVIENYYGAFEVGDTLSQYTNEDASDTASAVGVISSIDRQSLAEAHPTITLACEALVRYWWKHTTDFENTGTQKDGTSLRREQFTEQEWPFTPEVRQLLSSYVRSSCL